MPRELDRFLTLFDALVDSTNKWMENTPSETLDWVPFDNPNMKFGDRISTITIRSLYIHTIMGECGWAPMLRDCAPRAALRPVPDPALAERLTNSTDLVGDATELHKRNMAIFASYSQERLDMPIKWMDREWTVMGFLWGIYSHRSYHLGNIDLYMREADAPAPDFFSSFRPVMA